MFGFTISAFLIYSLSSFTVEHAEAVRGGGVSENGRLRVSGNRIHNKNGVPFSAAGNSLFWSNTGWGGSVFYNTEAVGNMKSQFGSNIVRAAMGVGDEGGYITDASNKNRVETVVDAAIANDMYVLIDWHSHDAENYRSQAQTFFSEMAQKYGSYDNVIYEIYNEPTTQSWSGTIKPYAEAVISSIRQHDSNNLIIVGNPTWSQDVDVACNDRLSDSNTAYTLHFYAGVHTQSLRDKGNAAMNNGCALFVTEWGAGTQYGVDYSSTTNWINWMRDNDISHCNWAINQKAETWSMFNSPASTTGPWTDLTASGTLVSGIIQDWNGGGNPSTTATSGPTQTGGSCDISRKYKQCGGENYSGETCCPEGTTCRASNQYWSGCMD